MASLFTPAITLLPLSPSFTLVNNASSECSEPPPHDSSVGDVSTNSSPASTPSSNNIVAQDPILFESIDVGRSLRLLRSHS